MKSTITLFQICILLCGVFGVDADEVKTVMEGESVTLNSDLTEIQGINLILWRFGASGSVIAQIDGEDISYPYLTEIFGGRLQLDQTGSLTIKNMRTNHTGQYKLQITRNSVTSSMTFSVTVYESPSVIDAYKAEMKTVSETEGNSVTLQTDVTEPHGDELIVWRFGDEGKLIAKCDKETKSSQLYEDTDMRFRDRLQLDNQTGSLTITNTTNTDSGFYTVMISSSSKQMLHKIFNVTVSENATEGDTHVKEETRIEPVLSSGAKAGIVVGVLLVVFAAAAAAAVFYYRRKICKYERHMVTVMEGDDVTLKSGAKIQKDDRIGWMFRPQETLIAERPETRETYDGGLRFKDRLELDEMTGSLTIRNTRTTDSGEYKLRIKTKSGNSYKTFIVVDRGNGVYEYERPLLNQEDMNGVNA